MGGYRGISGYWNEYGTMLLYFVYFYLKIKVKKWK